MLCSSAAFASITTGHGQVSRGGGVWGGGSEGGKEGSGGPSWNIVWMKWAFR